MQCLRHRPCFFPGSLDSLEGTDRAREIQGGGEVEDSGIDEWLHGKRRCVNGELNGAVIDYCGKVAGIAIAR